MTTTTQIPAAIFRQYDVRGIVGRDLTPDVATALGRAYAQYVDKHAEKGAVALGRDNRPSGSGLRDALVEGLTSAGRDVVDIGVVPTPLLYYSVFHLKADGAVMITGSHNPAEYNGFKIVSGTSTIHGDEIQELRRMIERRDFNVGQGSEKSADIVTPYVDEISAPFQFKRRVKMVADGGNGTAGPVMRRILRKLNCEATELFFDMDGRFPNHHPDPTVPKNLARLVETVISKHADLGIAFDGDADRIGAVDDRGTIIYGDQLMIIYAREILKRKPGATFIGEVKCSQTLYDDIRKHGGNPIMWRTGHSLIKAKMKETRAELAGEMSGHMFFADRYYGFDDALYAACRLMEIVAQSAEPLSAQLAGLPATVATPEIRVDCADDRKFEVVRRVKEKFKKTHEIVDVDGVRILFPQGWGLVRASNTQPVLVLRFEASTPELLAQYQQEVESALARAVAQ